MSYDENKQVVLEIVYSMDTINTEEVIKNYFNAIYDHISNEKYHNFNNITDMNKFIISNCYDYMNNTREVYKQSSKSSNQMDNQSNRNLLESIDIDSLKHKKDDKFTMKLKNKQEEFNSLIKKPDPQSVK